jgi:hypothetical protein
MYFYVLLRTKIVSSNFIVSVYDSKVLQKYTRKISNNLDLNFTYFYQWKTNINLKIQNLNSGSLRDISQHDIKIKWNGLRNNFFNERRKVRNSKVSGAGESEVK